MIGLVPVGQPLNTAYFSSESLSLSLFKFVRIFGYFDLFVFEVPSESLTQNNLCSSIPLQIIKKRKIKNIINGYLEQLQFKI